ncbi:elements of external origin [Nitrosomonas communis]|uniref:Elements of external origin n=1 Tax=Nitrosomonas communis TaxID=44574 RepID=A0A1I4UR96_9PROT|nr:elements of external origin [Nitrosomonas communis]SFM91514.1 hypothetical protein SAMN05421863_10694 [Nitrosomonas communis]
MGLSIRAYARHRGVSHVAVIKAIEAGRIKQEADGTIDPEQADREWERNTALPRKKSTMQNNTTAETISTGSANGTSLLQACTVNEVVKAQTNKVRLAQLKGELVDRPQAIAHVFQLARTERDAWLNWPARISAQLAAKLDVDPHAMHVALEAAVREHLQELGELRPRID